MPNMSYCRFRNTATDMDDCFEHIDDKDLSEEEKEARLLLIRYCVEIALDYGHEVGREVEAI
jgi:hypothetical protein